MPQRKKDPSARARANKASTAATLRPVESPDFSGLSVVQLRAELSDLELPISGRKPALLARLTAALDPTPPLPARDGGWHAMTRAWWRDVWASPMSSEWHESDLHNVYICAIAYDDTWTGETATARQKAMAEFRQQRATLGLTPYDRRRLEWTIESAEEAKDRGAQRRGSTPAAPKAGAAKRTDPRAGLALVT